MNIHIEVIPEHEHRPGISGADWFWDKNGDLQVRVSKLSDWRREVILGFHEAAEAILCHHNGVSQQSVDTFDMAYDLSHASDLNAGDDPLAPYQHEHTLATAIERILAAELRVQWKEYDDELAAIPSANRTPVRSKEGKGKLEKRARKKNSQGH